MNKRNLVPTSRTDWQRVDAMTDKDIDYSDIPELDDDFFQHAKLQLPERKAVVTLRLDRDVLEWFKSKGRRYQTRINALLKSYVAAQRK